MCGFDSGRGEHAKKQPKLGLLTTQRKTDVLILINFIYIFHIAESMYIIIMKVSLKNCVSEGANTRYIDIYGCYIIKN